MYIYISIYLSISNGFLVLHLLLDVGLFSPLLSVYCVFTFSIYMQCSLLKQLSIPVVFILYIISTELHIDFRFYWRG
jgi:hypothetical protein